LEQRAARQNAEQFSLCAGDRFVLIFSFFFIKKKEYKKQFIKKKPLQIYEAAFLLKLNKINL
jgi:hypothetical protein